MTTPEEIRKQEEAKAKAEKAKTAPEEKEATGTYPASDGHIKVFEAGGITYKDNPIGRAWCRMYDKGQHLGPALTEIYQLDDGFKRQAFSGGTAAQSLDAENVNKTVEFFDARGFVGSESGI